MYLLDLLPMASEIIVPDIAVEKKIYSRLILILEQAQIACNCFLNGQLHLFDPHVGETCCQIRAYMYSLMYNDLQIHLKLKKFFKNAISCLKKISDCQLWCASPEYICKKLPLGILLKEVNINLGTEVVSILLGYILTRYSIKDSEMISQKINHKAFQNFSNESVSYSVKLMRLFQRLLSYISTDFIYQLASELEQKKVSFYAKGEVLKSLNFVSDYNRDVLPCLAITEVILMHIKYISHLPMSFIVSVVSKVEITSYILTFQNSEKDLNFIPVESFNLNEKTPCLLTRVLAVNTTKFNNQTYFNLLKETYCREGIENLYLAYSADHPQFSGKSLFNISEVFEPVSSGKIHEISEYMSFLKCKAMESGCAKNNPRVLFVKHILSDTIQHVPMTQRKLPALSGNFYLYPELSYSV